MKQGCKTILLHIRLLGSRKPCYQATANEKGETTTVIAAFNAMGTYVKPMVIMGGKWLKPADKTFFRSLKYQWTEEGLKLAGISAGMKLTKAESCLIQKYAELRKYPRVTTMCFPVLTVQPHVSGWHVVNRVCQEAEIQPELLTATKMRHRVSAFYAVVNTSVQIGHSVKFVSSLSEDD